MNFNEQKRPAQLELKSLCYDHMVTWEHVVQIVVQIITKNHYTSSNKNFSVLYRGICYLFKRFTHELVTCDLPQQWDLLWLKRSW